MCVNNILEDNKMSIEKEMLDELNKYLLLKKVDKSEDESSNKKVRLESFFGD